MKWNNNNNWTTCYYTAKILLCIKKLMLMLHLILFCVTIRLFYNLPPLFLIVISFAFTLPRASGSIFYFFMASTLQPFYLLVAFFLFRMKTTKSQVNLANRFSFIHWHYPRTYKTCEPKAILALPLLRPLPRQCWIDVPFRECFKWKAHFSLTVRFSKLWFSFSFHHESP